MVQKNTTSLVEFYNFAIPNRVLFKMHVQIFSHIQIVNGPKLTGENMGPNIHVDDYVCTLGNNSENKINVYESYEQNSF